MFKELSYVPISDNKYVQYRLMADEWSITETDWQGVDNEPTQGSKNLVESGGTRRYIVNSTIKLNTFGAIGERLNSDDADSFYISDNTGNVVLIVKDGHVISKNFNSGDFKPSPVQVSDNDFFCITDESGNVILEVVDGQIKTKYFDSSSIIASFKSFSILGDSWSAMKGFVYPDTNAYWYPVSDPGAQGHGETNDVDSVEKMWWYKLATNRKLTLVKCAARSGSRIANSGTAGTSFLYREGDVGESPELIIIFGTKNDDNNSELGEYVYSDWTETDLTKYRPALAKLLYDMKYAHIGSTILFVSNSYNTDKKTSAATICEHYNIPFLQLNLSSSELGGGHPNSLGMTNIYNAVNNKLNTL